MLLKIGETSMVTLRNIVEPGRVFVKLERENPSGSIKDRASYFMILDGEKKGFLGEKNRVIVEPTSGNTGISLSVIGAKRGYQVILTMPSNMSPERVKILKTLGADVILTPSEEGMEGAIKKARKIRDEIGAYMPDQFTNPANVLVHELTTGPEILKQMSYDIDLFVTGIGTGGTITGIAQALRRALGKRIKIIGVEPKGSPIITQGRRGPHKIQGIGAGFVPPILDLEILDDVITISDDDAIDMTKRLIGREGILSGISTGANVKAALILAEKYKAKRVVTISPDSMEKYLSMLL